MQLQFENQMNFHILSPGIDRPTHKDPRPKGLSQTSPRHLAQIYSIRRKRHKINVSCQRRETRKMSPPGSVPVPSSRVTYQVHFHRVELELGGMSSRVEGGQDWDSRSGIPEGRKQQEQKGHAGKWGRGSCKATRSCNCACDPQAPSVWIWALNRWESAGNMRVWTRNWFLFWAIMWPSTRKVR